MPSPGSRTPLDASHIIHRGIRLFRTNPGLALLVVIILTAVLSFSFAFQTDLIQVGDAGYYLMLGMSLAKGQGLSDISQPDAPSKHWWPIGFPAAVALFYKLIGPHWIAAKTLILLALYSSLWLWGISLMRKRMDPIYVILIIGCIGLSSNIHMMSSYLYNETFFLSASLFFFVLYQHWENRLGFRQTLILTLLSLYIATIRHVGLALPLALGGWLAYRAFVGKTKPKWLWILPILAIGLYLTTMKAVPALGSPQFSAFIQTQMPANPVVGAEGEAGGTSPVLALISKVSRRILRSFRGYGLSLIPQAMVRSIYDLAPMSKTKALAMLAITGTALAGILRSFRTIPFVNVYALSFLGILFLYGPLYDRLLTPLAPFLLLYLFYGILWITEVIPLGRKKAGILLLTLWAVVIAANGYRSFTNPREYMPAQFGNQAYQDCVQWIVEHAQPGEVVISQIHPHIFLRRGKYNAPFRELPDPETHLLYLDRTGANYLMISPFYQRPTYTYMQGVLQTVDTYPKRFERVCGIGDESSYVLRYLGEKEKAKSPSTGNPS